MSHHRDAPPLVPPETPKSQAKASLMELITCSICLERLKLPVTTPCGHSFCKQCLEDTRARKLHTCPCCRAPINRKKLTLNVVLNDVLENLPSPSSSAQPHYAADPGVQSLLLGLTVPRVCKNCGQSFCRGTNGAHVCVRHRGKPRRGLFSRETRWSCCNVLVSAVRLHHATCNVFKCFGDKLSLSKDVACDSGLCVETVHHDGCTCTPHEEEG